MLKSFPCVSFSFLSSFLSDKEVIDKDRNVTWKKLSPCSSICRKAVKHITQPTYTLIAVMWEENKICLLKILKFWIFFLHSLPWQKPSYLLHVVVRFLLAVLIVGQLKTKMLVICGFRKVVEFPLIEICSEIWELIYRNAVHSGVRTLSGSKIVPGSYSNSIICLLRTVSNFSEG